MAKTFLEGVREMTAAECRSTRSSTDSSAIEKVNRLIDAIRADDAWDLDTVANRFTQTLGCDRIAALAFLAAWGTWAQRRFQGQVLKEDVVARPGSRVLK